jgi:hypothetical protein
MRKGPDRWSHLASHIHRSHVLLPLLAIVAAKPPGYYVVRETGLFPAPYPQDHANLDKVVEHFRVLGIFMAKALQDGRLVDMPLSRSFCKLLCGQELAMQDLYDISPSVGRTVLALQNLANEKRVVDADYDTKESRREAYKHLKISWPPNSTSAERMAALIFCFPMAELTPPRFRPRHRGKVFVGGS